MPLAPVHAVIVASPMSKKFQALIRQPAVVAVILPSAVVLLVNAAATRAQRPKQRRLLVATRQLAIAAEIAMVVLVQKVNVPAKAAANKYFSLCLFRFRSWESKCIISSSLT